MTSLLLVGAYIGQTVGAAPLDLPLFTCLQVNCAKRTHTPGTVPLTPWPSGPRPPALCGLPIWLAFGGSCPQALFKAKQANPALP